MFYFFNLFGDGRHFGGFLDDIPGQPAMHAACGLAIGALNHLQPAIISPIVVFFLPFFPFGLYGIGGFADGLAACMALRYHFRGIVAKPLQFGFVLYRGELVFGLVPVQIFPI